MAAVDLTACTVDVERGLVTRPDGGSARLTTRERALLAYLVERPGVVVSRTELLERVWKYHPETVTRVDIITMNRLRKKVERDAHAPDHFLTVHGEGYRFVPGVAASETPSWGPPPAWPAERDRWIGREQELDALAKLFADGARMVTLLGMGGAGKTRLAVRFGWTHRSDFPGEPWMIDLSHARDGEAVLATAATTFGAADVGRAIAARGRCLVVVDNFEQVAAFAPGTLGTWLDKAPDACFLVTSREALRITGENVLAIGPLVEDDAKALFDERAAAAGSESGDDETVRTLVRMLDGIPLAIELAAARARVMSAAEMIERMGARFDLLTKSRGRTDRHATLRATLDWSWDLLTTAEQSAFAQLSVFEGGFTLGAAEEVVEVAGNAIDLVESLVDKSLLVSRGPRLAFLVTTRDYARMRLDESGPLASDAAADRHMRHFARVGLGLREKGGPSGIADPADVEDFVAGCRRAIEAREIESVSATIWPAWSLLLGSFRSAPALELLSAATAVPGAEQSPTIQALLANALWLKGQHAAARDACLAAIGVARASGDALAEAHVWRWIGGIDREQNALQRAQQALARSYEISSQIGARALAAANRANLAIVAIDLGDLDTGLEHLLSTEVLDAGGAPLRQSGNRLQLGLIHLALGEVAEARRRYEEAIGLAQDARYVVAEIDALAMLVGLCITTGDLDRARQLLATAETRSAGLTEVPKLVHWAAGELAAANLDVPSARAHFERVFEKTVREGLGPVELDARLSLAERTLAPEDLAFVDERLGAVETYSRVDQGRLLALAACRLVRSRPIEARRALADAEAILRGSKAVLHLWRTLLHRAELDVVEGKRDDARAALDEVEAIARKMGARPESEIVGRLAAGRALLITGR